MSDTRNFIAGLITEINTATDPESVTNQMVARVMQYFLEKLEEQVSTDQITDRAITAIKIALGSITGSHLVEKTITQRELAPELTQRLQNLEDAINTMTGDDATNAIRRFQEVITFLAGVTDDKTLTGLLNGIRQDLNKKADKVVLDLSGIYEAASQGTGYTVISPEDLEDVFGTPAAAYALRGVTIFAKIDERDSGGYPATMHYYDGNYYTLVVNKGDEILSLSIYDEGFQATEFEHSGSAILASTTVIPEGSVTEGKLSSGVKALLHAKEVIVTGFWGVWPIRSQMVVPAKAGLYMYFTDSQTLNESVDINGSFEWVEKDLEENVIYVDGTKKIPYIWDGTDMVAIAPEKVPASIFNATAEAPVNGFYTLIDPENTELSATHAAWNAGKAVLGLMISFKLSAKVVKTYQYIGATVTEQNWYNAENWQDFGSLAAGSESFIIIDNLIGHPSVGDYYTLETAVQELLKYQQTSGVTYAKVGLIITYSTGENTMECKQFQGTTVTDFGETGLWKDFGGGGSTNVEVTDKLEEDSQKALSSGGAYNLMPQGITLDTETPGVVKMQLVNAAGEGVGDEQQFAVGTGTGGSATIVSIVCEKSPLYVSAGGTVELKAAIRSVTSQGQVETANDIETVEIWDRDTNQVLETLNVNRGSSADLETFDFIFNLTSYFTTAGTKRLKLVAIDNTGNSGQRTINVVSVDVTVSSAQATLNYTAATALAVGGAAKSLPMYKFSNNASDKGIFVTTEIFIGNAWRTLGTATIMDTYSHSVTINPTDCLGYTLAHGAYPIRIHGEDIGSRRNDIVGTGVMGNYLHTAVMVIEEGNTTPIILTRWYSENETARVKL